MKLDARLNDAIGLAQAMLRDAGHLDDANALADIARMINPLRDEIAIAAMQGMLAASSMLASASPETIEAYFDTIPKSSYQIADLMLEERAK